MRSLIIAVALLGVLVLAMGCAQKAGPSGGGIPGGGGGTPGTVPAHNLTVDDLGVLDNPDSESLDTGDFESI